MTTTFMRDQLSGFAVDLGGTKTAAARIEGGRIVAREQAATDGKAGLDGQLAGVEALLQKLGWTMGAPMGVALTGRLTQDGYWHAVNAGTLSAINGVAIGAELAKRFGASCGYCNDAQAAAVGESYFGVGQGSLAFGYLTVSTGVGGGFVLNGQALRSPNGLAGHVGFVSSRLGSDLCGSGRVATVESVAAGRAIAKAAAAAGHAECDARAVFVQSQAGAAWAETIIDRSAAAIAILCADLTAILGLDRMALGGSIGLAEGYLDRVVLHLNKEPELFRVSVKHAELGQDSALLGALVLAALEH